VSSTRGSTKRSASHKKNSITQKGDYYNLQEIYQRVNERYFEGKLALSIAWVGNKQAKPRTRIMFGSYNQRTQHIKIHRRLDASHVPMHFIEFVIYHEMLHHVLPPILTRRRRRIHHPVFIQREREFHAYDLAMSFREEVKRNWFNKD